MLWGQVGSVLLEEPGRLKLEDCVGGACRITEVSTQKPEGARAVQQKQVGPLAYVALRFSGVAIAERPSMSACMGTGIISKSPFSTL